MFACFYLDEISRSLLQRPAFEDGRRCHYMIESTLSIQHNGESSCRWSLRSRDIKSCANADRIVQMLKDRLALRWGCSSISGLHRAKMSALWPNKSPRQKVLISFED